MEEFGYRSSRPGSLRNVKIVTIGVVAILAGFGTFAYVKFGDPNAGRSMPPPRHASPPAASSLDQAVVAPFRGTWTATEPTSGLDAFGSAIGSGTTTLLPAVSGGRLVGVPVSANGNFGKARKFDWKVGDQIGARVGAGGEFEQVVWRDERGVVAGLYASGADRLTSFEMPLPVAHARWLRLAAGKRTPAVMLAVVHGGNVFASRLTGGKWGAWVNLGGLATSGAAAVETASHFEVYVRGGDNSLWVNRFDDKPTNAGHWTRIGDTILDSPDAVLLDSGEIVLVGVGTPGSLLVWSRKPGDPWRVFAAPPNRLKGPIRVFRAGPSEAMVVAGDENGDTIAYSVRPDGAISAPYGLGAGIPVGFSPLGGTNAVVVREADVLRASVFRSDAGGERTSDAIVDTSASSPERKPAARKRGN
jgi:hypothetical protein